MKGKEEKRFVLWSNMDSDGEDEYDVLGKLRSGLDIVLPEPILVIANLGLWNGRHSGYREILSRNLRDCFYTDADLTEWYLDRLGDLRADGIHHDGRNYYLYRIYLENVSDAARESLKDKIWNNTFTRTDITRATRRLGDVISERLGLPSGIFRGQGGKHENDSVRPH